MRSTESRHISTVARMEGNFLEVALPVQAFATLETPRQWSQGLMDGAFASWIRVLQAHHRQTLGWLVSHEMTPQRHLHAALVAARPLDCAFAERSWVSIVASRDRATAQVNPYRDGLCGMGYILKRLDSPREEVGFSRNLSAFAPDSTTRFYGRTGAEKRQRSRIHTQLKNAPG